MTVLSKIGKNRALALALALAASPAVAGDCRYESVNGQTVQTCDDGFVETQGPHGRRSWGVRNGGFARTLGQAAPSWAIENRPDR
jgi:hypothetical protein